jgi:hypothetical protein
MPSSLLFSHGEKGMIFEPFYSLSRRERGWSEGLGNRASQMRLHI